MKTQVLPQAPIRNARPWTNWSGNEHGGQYYFKARNVKEIQQAVERAELDGKKLKAVGSGFSCSAAAKSDGYWVDTSDLNQVINYNFLPKGSTAKNQTHLVYVEAGIKLYRLAELLWARKRSLPTLGGSMGQSLSGVIMTSTHGTDFELPPIPGMVRAIHMIGPKGQEYWLEDHRSPISTDALLKKFLPDYNRDLKIIRDQDAFQSALVAVGRCGIVYAYVIEVEDRFKMEERRIKTSWNLIRDQLKAAAHSKNWTAHLEKIYGKSPFYNPHFRKQFQSLDIALNPEDHQAAWVTTRWKVFANAEGKFIADYGMGKGPNYGQDGKILELAQLADKFELSDILSVAKFGYHVTLGTSPVKKRGRNYHITSSFPKPTYRNYPEMYQHFWNSKKARFLEVFFNAEEDTYLTYVDRLFQAYRRPNAKTQAGYIAIRFTSASQAPLSMQQWKKTASIEIVLLEGFSGTSKGLDIAIGEAERLNGVFHWGMLFQKQSNHIRLADWKKGARKIGIRKDDVFSSKFSQAHDLEP